MLSAFEQRIFRYCGRGGSQGQTQEGNTVVQPSEFTLRRLYRLIAGELARARLHSDFIDELSFPHRDPRISRPDNGRSMTLNAGQRRVEF